MDLIVEQTAARAVITQNSSPTSRCVKSKHKHRDVSLVAGPGQGISVVTWSKMKTDWPSVLCKTLIQYQNIQKKGPFILFFYVIKTPLSFLLVRFLLLTWSLLKMNSFRIKKDSIEGGGHNRLLKYRTLGK